MELINLLNYDLNSMKTVMDQLGERSFRATQLIQWIHQRGVIEFDHMTDLSKTFRSKLEQACCVQFLEVAYESCSQDGTVKWLLRLHDGNCIETVFIPDITRGTLCVSSQVGCALNCSFCATGKEGFNRNLSTAEIIGQVWLARSRLLAMNNNQPITNVVMMGMGEPLLNYDNVLAAMNLMLDDHAYGLSKYRVTLSTSGVVPMLEKLKLDSPVAVAVSLHAANDELRNQLVPINKKYPLNVLIPICKNYYQVKKRSVTYEYVMLKDINDSLQDAKQLLKLLEGSPCKINLIPFNPFAKSHYECSSREVIERFQNYLMKAGMNTRVRKTRGDDIEAACGQLAGDIQDRTGRHARWLKTGSLIPKRTVDAKEV